MRGSLFTLLGSVVVTAASCSVYDEAMTLCTRGQPCDTVGGRPNGGDTGTGGNGTAADSSVAGGGPAYCGAPTRATYPDPPPPGASSTKDVEIVAAQYTIDLGDKEPAPIRPTHYLDIGFDLDKTCTTTANPKEGECRPPPFALGVIDGKGGIDNALGGLIQGVRERIGDFSSENYTKDIQAGKTNVLLRLTKWNGEPNDDEVTVATMVAAAFDVFTKDAKPLWQGNDAFPIASDSLNGTVDNPKFVDTHAYVTDNKVVATLAEANLRLDVGLSAAQRVKLDLKLSAAFIVCNIVPTTEGRWGYVFERCTLGGRWLADDLVQQLDQYPNPLDNNRPLCRGNPTYETFKRLICGQRDIYHTIGSPTLTCDALTMGVTYTMKPVLLGNVYQLEPVQDRCCVPPGCLKGSVEDHARSPRYDCCNSIGGPDGGTEACGTGLGGAGGGGNGGAGGSGTGGRGAGGGSSGGAGGRASGGAGGATAGGAGGGGGTDAGVGGKDASPD